MKNRVLTYCLLGIVALIWGGIFYKIFSSLSTTDNKVKPVTQSKLQNVISTYEDEETFSIRANYRDPFLGTIQTAVDSASLKVTKRASPLKKVTPVIPVDWSFIQYLGLIRNPKSDKKIGLVTVHGQELMISEGQVIGDLKCIRPFKDSVIIVYQGRLTCIRK